MSTEVLSLFMDIVLSAFLAAMIYFVIRLSKNLQDFKAHRRDFDAVITNLLSSIDQAERSINTLKQVSAQEAGELERLIGQSKVLSEDLRIINDASEAMANRLEQVAEKNRKIVQPSQDVIGRQVKESHYRSQDNKISSPVDPDRVRKEVKKEPPVIKKEGADYRSTLKAVDPKKTAQEQDKALPSFMIQDRDYGDLDDLNNRLDATSANNDDMSDSFDEDDDMPEKLQSQAERELFAAIRRSKRDVSRGGQ